MRRREEMTISKGIRMTIKGASSDQRPDQICSFTSHYIFLPMVLIRRRISKEIRDQIRMMQTIKGTQLSSLRVHQSNYDDDEDKEVDCDFGIMTMVIIIMIMLMDNSLFQISWRFGIFI